MFHNYIRLFFIVAVTTLNTLPYVAASPVSSPSTANATSNELANLTYPPVIVPFPPFINLPTYPISSLRPQLMKGSINSDTRELCMARTNFRGPRNFLKTFKNFDWSACAHLAFQDLITDEQAMAIDNTMKGIDVEAGNPLSAQATVAWIHSCSTKFPKKPVWEEFHSFIKNFNHNPENINNVHHIVFDDEWDIGMAEFRGRARWWNWDIIRSGALLEARGAPEFSVTAPVDWDSYYQLFDDQAIYRPEALVDIYWMAAWSGIGEDTQTRYYLKPDYINKVWLGQEKTWYDS